MRYVLGLGVLQGLIAKTGQHDIFADSVGIRTLRSHQHAEIIFVAVVQGSHCCFNWFSVRCESLRLVLVVMKWLFERRLSCLRQHPTAKN